MGKLIRGFESRPLRKVSPFRKESRPLRDESRARSRWLLIASILGMVSEAAGRIEVIALGASAVETLVWRMRGELRVTVIVKARFAFEPDAAMRVEPPEEI